MAMVTRTVPISDTWTLVTTKLALLQFNDKMYMAITSGGTPVEPVGFTMFAGEKYINGADGINVWAKTIQGGTNRESVRVAEDVV